MVAAVGCEASNPLNRFAMYVAVKKTMNYLNRDSRIIAFRLSRGCISLLKRRDVWWDVRGGSFG
jgi:hypothetical protein